MKKYKVQSILLVMSIVVSTIFGSIAQPCIDKDLTDLDEADIEQYLDQKARACLINLSDETFKEMQVKIREYKAVIKKYEEINADQQSKKLETEIEGVVKGKIKTLENNMSKASGQVGKIDQELKAAKTAVETDESNLAQLKAEYDKAKSKLESSNAKYQGVLDRHNTADQSKSALSKELQQYKTLLNSI